MMVRKSDARFKVDHCHVDGKSEGVLTIKAPTLGNMPFVSYRPKHSRREYKLPLNQVAEMLCSRAAKIGAIYEKEE